jgi:hypothetical protein
MLEERYSILSVLIVAYSKQNSRSPHLLYLLALLVSPLYLCSAHTFHCFVCLRDELVVVTTRTIEIKDTSVTTCACMLASAVIATLLSARLLLQVLHEVGWVVKDDDLYCICLVLASFPFDSIR